LVFSPFDGRDERGRTTMLPPALRAHTFKPGEIHNPAGKGGKYQECKRLCREASPSAARVIIALANDPNEDSRVRYMAAAWVHEQAWGKPKEYDPASETPAGPKFNPRDYSPEQLDVIEAALRLMLHPPAPQTESEVAPPRQASQIGRRFAPRPIAR
jgi:hypothetical protein